MSPARAGVFILAALAIGMIAAFAGACGDDGFGTAPPADAGSAADVSSADASVDDTPGDAGGDAGDVRLTGAPAACGAPPHEWLPPDEVGAPVRVEELLVSNLTPQAVDALLASADSAGIVTPVHGVRNFRFRYTTQDRGEPVEATAVLGVPVGLPEGAAAPVILWLHGLSGFVDACAPSRDVSEAIVPALLLSSLGYVTVSPDYPGLIGFGEPSPEGALHPALVGESVALTSLDAVRAAAAVLEDTAGAPPLDPNRVAVFGGSQGGHAAFFTERYAAHYAPELTILGVAAGMAPTDLLAHAREAVRDVGPVTAAIAAALVTMADWYRHDGPLTEVLAAGPPADMATALPTQMATACDAADPFEGLDDVAHVFSAAFIAAAEAGAWDDVWPWGCFLGANSVAWSGVPRLLPDTPFLVVDAVEDDLVAIDVERASVDWLCRLDYRIELVQCAAAGHRDLTGALPLLIDWLRARLDGEPVDPAAPCAPTDPISCALPGE